MMWLLLVHAASTWAMAGLVWFVQLVHYPLFAYADRSDGRFTAFSHAHQRRATWIVAPLMLAEGVCAATLLVWRPEPVPWLLALAGAVLAAQNWLATFFVQVPLHRRLTEGYDAQVHRLLVRSNWTRTIAWTARGVIAGWMIALG